MASTTNLKFPDGRIQENVEVLTSFEKNNELVLLFKTDIMANQNQVFGLCYYVDGMYQNIVDPVKQKEIKGYLVDILKDRMDNSNYRVVPEEILVTADPYYPLALREANSITIAEKYTAFLQSLQTEEVKNVEQPVVNETNNMVTSEVKEEVPSNTIENGGPSTVDTNINSPESVIDPLTYASTLDSANENVVPTQEVNTTVENDLPDLNGVIPQTPVVDTVVNPVPQEEVVPGTIPEAPQMIQPNPDLNGLEASTPVESGVQDIVPPQGIEINNEPVSTVESQTPVADTVVNPVPQEEIVPGTIPEAPQMIQPNPDLNGLEASTPVESGVQDIVPPEGIEINNEPVSTVESQTPVVDTVVNPVPQEEVVPGMNPEPTQMVQPNPDLNGLGVPTTVESGVQDIVPPEGIEINNEPVSTVEPQIPVADTVVNPVPQEKIVPETIPESPQMIQPSGLDMPDFTNGLAVPLTVESGVQDIIPPEGIEINNEPVSTVESQTPIADTVVNPVPQEEVVSEAPVTQNSAVTDSYLNHADQIAEQMQNRYLEYQKAASELYETFKKDISTMRDEMKNNLEESQAKNSLSQQTLEKVQSLAQSMDNNSQNMAPVPNPQIPLDALDVANGQTLDLKLSA